jgi:hypothetical protein
MARIVRHSTNSGNKALARMFREHTIRPIKPLGTRHKPSFRSQRSDAGKKRS